METLHAVQLSAPQGSSPHPSSMLMLNAPARGQVYAHAHAIGASIAALKFGFSWLLRIPDLSNSTKYNKTH